MILPAAQPSPAAAFLLAELEAAGRPRLANSKVFGGPTRAYGPAPGNGPQAVSATYWLPPRHTSQPADVPRPPGSQRSPRGPRGAPGKPAPTVPLISGPISGQNGLRRSVVHHKTSLRERGNPVTIDCTRPEKSEAPKAFLALARLLTTIAESERPWLNSKSTLPG